MNNIILSNVNEYEITDISCENLLYTAREYGINEILVGPSSVSRMIKFLSKTEIKLSTTISYPSGCYFIEAKTAEIIELKEMHPEIEAYYVVMSVGKFLSGEIDEFNEEIKELIEAVEDKELHIITEISKMSEEKSKDFIVTCNKNGVKSIVMSTGFYPYAESFPTLEQMKIFKNNANELPVKAFCLDIKNALDSEANQIITNNLIGLGY